jgi:hypothetical protein
MKCECCLFIVCVVCACRIWLAGRRRGPAIRSPRGFSSREKARPVPCCALCGTDQRRCVRRQRRCALLPVAWPNEAPACLLFFFALPRSFACLRCEAEQRQRAQRDSHKAKPLVGCHSGTPAKRQAHRGTHSTTHTTQGQHRKNAPPRTQCTAPDSFKSVVPSLVRATDRHSSCPSSLLLGRVACPVAFPLCFPV